MTFKIINKNRKFTFVRWFAHWNAFQLTAINLGIWKAKYLLHDLDKPILNLFLENKRVTEIHRKFNNHHETNGIINDIDAAIIDWECSRLTKKDAQLNARDTLYLYKRTKLCDDTYIKVEQRINNLLL